MLRDYQGGYCQDPAHRTEGGDHINYHGAVYCGTHSTPIALQAIGNWQDHDGTRCHHCGAPICDACEHSAEALTCAYCETAYTPYWRRNRDGAVCAVAECENLVSAAYEERRADDTESCRSCGAPVCNDCAPVNGQPCGYCGHVWPLDRASWPYEHAPDVPCMAAPVLRPVTGERDTYTSSDGAVWRYQWDLEPQSCSHCGARVTALYCCLDDGADARCSNCVSDAAPHGELSGEQWSTPYTAPEAHPLPDYDAECSVCLARIWSGASAHPDYPLCIPCSLERRTSLYMSARDHAIAWEKVKQERAAPVTFTRAECDALNAVKRRAGLDCARMGYLLALLERGAITPDIGTVDTEPLRAALAAL